MKILLNVNGEKLPVVGLNIYEEQVTSAQVLNHNGTITMYYDNSIPTLLDTSKKLDLQVALEYPDIEAKKVNGNNKLINHLEMVLEKENELLTEIAIEAMEHESDLPFNLHIENLQKQYKYKQQRIFGFLDAVEEVKAFCEGWFQKHKEVK